MASTRDVQDMLGLAPSAGPKPKPSKKPSGSKVPKGDGVWNKEIRSLIGERAPPAHLLDAQPKFQKKRLSFKSGPVRRWHFKPFNNDARTDGLMLRHWKRTELVSKPYSRIGEALEAADEDSEKIQSELDAVEGPEYKFGANYNPAIEAPSFDHETYEKSLQSDSWTEEETRYLMDCYQDFYGKWAVIWDRYEWHPTPSNTAEASDGSRSDEKGEVQPDQMDIDQASQLQAAADGEPPKPRTMEDLKQRFFTVSAAMLAIQTPPTQMTASQYRAHEQMTRYNPAQEGQRKRFKESQMVRSKDEKREEEHLLSELRRIYFNQERIDTDLRDLRARLDHGLTDDRNPGQQYSSSRELQELFNRFIRKDSVNRPSGAQQPGGARRSLPGQADAAGSAGSPTGHGPGQKKGNVASTTEGAAPSVRQLGPRAAVKNGLSNHDRLPTGVTFRSDRVNKLRQPSKSMQVNNKIGAILTQMDIPEYILMPTNPVLEALERLVNMASAVVENRRCLERIDGEIKVLEKMLGIEGQGDQKPESGESGPSGEGGENDGTADADEKPAKPTAHGIAEQVEQKDSQADEDAEGSPDDDGEEQAANDEPTPAAAPADGTLQVGGAAAAAGNRTKRSASVLSASSAGSRAGTKRQKSLRK